MRKVGLMVAVVALISTILTGCGPISPATQTQTSTQPSSPQGGSDRAFSITSTAFSAGEKIPVKYTCDGQNISPALNWMGAQSSTAAFALTVDDPDAPGGVFTHWVIFNIPPDATGLPEAVPKTGKLDDGAIQGNNGARNIGYMGPCPPKGSPHHYRFTLYELDRPLDLSAGATKDQVLQAMAGHILGQMQLVGIYQR